MSERSIEILSPVAAATTDQDAPLSPPAALAGKTLALLDNRHPNVTPLLARLGELLSAHTAVASILPRVKPSFSRPCPPDLLDELAERAQVIVTGVGT